MPTLASTISAQKPRWIDLPTSLTLTSHIPKALSHHSAAFSTRQRRASFSNTCSVTSLILKPCTDMNNSLFCDTSAAATPVRDPMHQPTNTHTAGKTERACGWSPDGSLAHLQSATPRFRWEWRAGCIPFRVADAASLYRLRVLSAPAGRCMGFQDSGPGFWRPASAWGRDRLRRRIGFLSLWCRELAVRCATHAQARMHVCVLHASDSVQPTHSTRLAGWLGIDGAAAGFRISAGGD